MSRESRFIKDSVYKMGRIPFVDRRKESILAFLKSNVDASPADVAALLGVSKQAALRHLDALEAEGLVEHRLAPHEGPGRPGHAYRLTSGAAEHFPHAHRQLAAELIAFMPPRDVERFFAQRAARTEAAVAPTLSGLPLRGKVARVAAQASASGHMTEVVDNGDGTFAIRHRNCPIGDLAAATGHPCQNELAMYERLFGAAVERTTWAAANDPACTYVIKTKERRASS
jgi:predicted ArsR family transcriptional regulator